MIAEACFTKGWLDQCREEVGRIDPGLLEKSIYAFDLLGRLAAAGLPFCFKGGTALLLLLDNFRRLSIDVDITCAVPRADVARIIEEVARESPFSSVQPDERDPARLPKRHHYALQFPSVVNPRVPATLQLDVLEDESHYPEIQRMPLRSRFVLPSEEIEVTVPTMEGLLADKLTAFAPTTVGVPYGAFKAGIKIAKQICDVGELFDHAQDGNKLADAYERLFAAENGYRGNAFSMDQSLDDTIEAARLFNSVNLKGYTASPECGILTQGVTQVDSHMIGRHYTLDDAKIAAARAAHLAALIRTGAAPQELSSIKFGATSIDAIKDSTLTGRFGILNRLKRFNSEAFYHWSRIQECGLS